ILKRGVHCNALHQPLAQAAPAMRFKHEDVADISNGGKITDHAGKPNLRTLDIIDTEAKRMCNRPLYDFSWNAPGPVGIGQKAVHCVQIQLFARGAHQELVPPIFDGNFRIDDARGRHAHILPLHPRGKPAITRSSSPTLRTPSAKTKPVATRPCIYTASRPWCNAHRAAPQLCDSTDAVRTPPRRCERAREET